MTMARYYVYTLSDPANNEVFYVGKGKGSRHQQHECDARKGVRSVKCDRIREVIDAGGAPVARIVKRFEHEQDAYDFEAELIEDIGIDNLTNVAVGGNGGRRTEQMARDKDLIEATVMLAGQFRRFGRRIKIRIDGNELDLGTIYDGYVSAIQVVIKRRGKNWVESQMKRLGAVLVAE